MPISPPPVQSWRPEFIPAYLSNGLIGLRAGPIPLIEGVAIANGLAGIDPVERDEGFARAPYPVAGGATTASGWLLRSSAFATKPLAFISSTKACR